MHTHVLEKKLASKSESNVLKEGISSGMLLGGVASLCSPFCGQKTNLIPLNPEGLLYSGFHPQGWDTGFHPRMMG